MTIAVEIVRLSSSCLRAEIQTFPPVWQSPFWIFYFHSIGTWFILALVSCPLAHPKTYAQPLELLIGYFVYNRYMHFRFGGRHRGYSTSAHNCSITLQSKTWVDSVELLQFRVCYVCKRRQVHVLVVSWPQSVIHDFRYTRFLALMVFLCWCAVKHQQTNNKPDGTKNNGIYTELSIAPH